MADFIQMFQMLLLDWLSLNGQSYFMIMRPVITTIFKPVYSICRTLTTRLILTPNHTTTKPKPLPHD